MKPFGRANPTLTFALCASLVVHAFLLLSFLYWYVHRPPVILRVATLADPKRAAIIVDLPPPSTPPTEKKPTAPPKPPPKPPTETPKQFPHMSAPPLKDDSGEANGVGTANRSSPGLTPMQARQGLEQAKLSRNPKAMPDDSASGLDTPPATPQPSPLATAPEPAAVGVPSNDAAVAPVPVPEKQPTLIAVADPTQAAPPPPMKTVTKTATAKPAVALPVKKPEAQPGRGSDTDSMAFSKANNVTFKDGRMLGRQGRRVRTTHIAFGLAAEGDAVSLADPRVVLGVTVDASGNVQNVIVLRSSGSDNIDSPVQTAVYNWWFEPLKDGSGKPQPDVWVVTIE